MSIEDFVFSSDDKELWHRFAGLVGEQVFRLRVDEDYMLRPSSFSSQISSQTSGSENSFIQHGDLNQLQRNTNALCHSNVGKQPLLGVPSVARDLRSLLSLILSSLHEVTSLNLDCNRCESTKRQKENKRNMKCVYKKSLMLESQLHQYTNPNLVTSLNRRAAKAAFEAELMCKMIDKLRKEGRKSVSEYESKRKARELTIKLKSLLGRQKCEWQCVGRLKETLAMAREMKTVLKFICQLSSLLEQSGDALRRMNESPPPYEYCSPYADLKIKRDKSYDRPAIVDWSEFRQGGSRATRRSQSEVTISLSLDFIPDRKARKPRRASAEVSVSESECHCIKTTSNCRKKKLSKGRSSSLVSMSDNARRHIGRRPSNSACTSPRCARTCTSRGSSPTRHRCPSLKDLSSPIKCKTSSDTDRRTSAHRHATCKKCLSVCKCCKIVKALCAGRCKKSKLINNLVSSKSHSAKTSRDKKSHVKSSPTLSDIESSQNLSSSEQETQREPKKRSKTNDKQKKVSATGRYRKESNKCAHRQVSSATPAGSCSKYYMHPRTAVDSSGSREPLLFSSRDTELNFKDDYLSFHYRGPSRPDGKHCPSSAVYEQETSSRQESIKTCEEDSSCTACDIDDIQDSSSSEGSEMKSSEPVSCTSRYTPEESKDVCGDNSLSFLVKLNAENSPHFSPNSPKNHPLKVQKCRSPPKVSLPHTQSCPTKCESENGTQTGQDIFLANQMPCPNMIQVSTKWRGTPPSQCCEKPSIETIIKLSMPDCCNKAPHTTEILKPSSRKSSGYSSRKSVPELVPQSSSESIRELPECPRSPSPKRHSSPESIRSPSPECRRSPSPVCKRSDTCARSTSPINVRSPTPKHSVGTSPIQIRSPSPNPSVNYGSPSPAATQTPQSSSPASRKSPLSPISPVESRQISEKFSKKPSLRSSDPSLTLPTASKMPSPTGSGNPLEELSNESRELLIDEGSQSENKEMLLDEPTSSPPSSDQNEIIFSHSNTNSVGNNSERDSPIASEKPPPVHTKQSSTTNSPSRPPSSITNSPSRPPSSITNSPSRPPSSITNSPSRPPSRKNTIRYTPSPVKTPSTSPVKTPPLSPVKTPSPSPSKTPPKKVRPSSAKKKMPSPRQESSEESELMYPSQETSRTASPERSRREELAEEPQVIPPPPPQQTWQNFLREGWTSWWKLILLILLILFVLHFVYCYLVAASCRNCRLPGPNILFYFLSWAMNSVRVTHNQPPPQ